MKPLPYLAAMLSLLLPVTAPAAVIDFEPGNTSDCFTVDCLNRQGFDWTFQSGGWGIAHQPFNPAFFNYNTSQGILGAKGAGNGAPPTLVDRHPRVCQSAPPWS